MLNKSFKFFLVNGDEPDFDFYGIPESENNFKTEIEAEIWLSKKILKHKDFMEGDELILLKVYTN